PALISAGEVTAADLSGIFSGFKGFRMAKSALEMAFLDAELRGSGVSLKEHLGGVRDSVPVGVSVGIFDGIPGLLDAVDGYLADGYLRVKLKIEPGWDVAMVDEVRSHVGDDVGLQVDANTAYDRGDIDHLVALDDFGLILVEQPFAADDLVGHAQLAAKIDTPVCLDESITSRRVTADALDLGASDIINIKAGRVGGYLEAKRIHDLCEERGVPVWCGGMLETGLGRAANLALASLPNFTLPGDISASSRYYHHDLTPPFEVENGHMRVPVGPGLGVEPDPDLLKEVTTKVMKSK
ncbi:MAG: o-succinylbenzoate synthase, partial [Acidimicrobiia bacterium]|nr:o-succinylbenzoate synthase [Acidimicrobiia bacterium]